MRTGAFSQGKSLVHVVGHWLGLLHTYHSPAGTEPCDCTYNPGDFVADTPQQARANTLSCQVRNPTQSSDEEIWKWAQTHSSVRTGMRLHLELCMPA